MSNDKPFGDNVLKYWERDMSVVPVQPGTKAGIKGWTHYQNNLPKIETREEWQKKYSHLGIAVITGYLLDDGTRLGAIDVDDDAYVEPIKRIIGQFPCAKKGKKGITIFVKVSKDAKSSAIPLVGPRIVDILVTKRMCVIPPSVHPDTKQPYEWIGEALYDVEITSLPFLSELQIEILKAILERENHKAIMVGDGTHDPAVSLMASLASKFADGDEEMVCRFVEAFLPSGYNGNLREELPEMFRSAREKFAAPTVVEYEPGDIGPIPLGYTQTGGYVFMNQKKKLLTILQPQSLLGSGNLYDLAPIDFWVRFFPDYGSKGEIDGVNTDTAADCLMQLCRNAGPFLAENVRGSGVWREGQEIIMNWSGDVPKSDKYTYVRFMSLPSFNNETSVNAQELLKWLRMFKWEKEGYAMLAFGWTAAAPICGALDWRPHIFINGPKNSGKSTIISGLADLLFPMAIVKDGASSEAGIRQTIGADSRPVILDEFESDREAHRMRQVIRMIRSASSATGAIAKGTPEGKALQFQLHSTFCLGAINPVIGTAADASRIVNLGLVRHNNDVAVKNEIQAALQELHRTSGAWSHQMVKMAGLMIENIGHFERAMPPGDVRHNKNMATLLGAAFTALHEKVAAQDEAAVMVKEMDGVVRHLAMAHEEDDASECLNRLLCFVPKDTSLGQMVRDARSQNIPAAGKGYAGLEAQGIMLHERGLLVANKHPALEEAFDGSIWAGGAWVPSLRRLPGVEFNDSLRARFSGGTQQRCTLIPFALLEETSAKATY